MAEQAQKAYQPETYVAPDWLPEKLPSLGGRAGALQAAKEAISNSMANQKQAGMKKSVAGDAKTNLGFG